MQRLYVSLKNIVKDEIALAEKAQVHHLKNVLRIKSGEEITLFDGRGNEYLCAVRAVSDKEVKLMIKDKRHSQKKKTMLTVACAIPKKAKFDEIVDKLTQLGVERIIPLLTERVIVKIEKEKEQARLERWKKIAQSAAEQSQRADLPVIEPVQELKEALSQIAKFDLKLIPHLTGERKTLKEILEKNAAKNILVLVGPEGDFTDGEVALAKKAGCIPVTLGDNVLRVDTAAIAVTSFIKLYADH